MPKFEKKAEKVEAWQTKGNRHVSTPDGPREALPGQWIVEAGNGLYLIMSDADFREKYEAKDKEATAMLKGELKTMDDEVAEQDKEAKSEAEESVAKDSDESQKEKAKSEKKDSKK